MAGSACDFGGVEFRRVVFRKDFAFGHVCRSKREAG